MKMNEKMSLNYQFIQKVSKNPFFENKIPVSYKKANSMQLVVVSKNLFLVTDVLLLHSNGLDDIHFSFSGNPSQYFFESHLLQGDKIVLEDKKKYK